MGKLRPGARAQPHGLPSAPKACPGPPGNAHNAGDATHASHQGPGGPSGRAIAQTGSGRSRPSADAHDGPVRQAGKITNNGQLDSERMDGGSVGANH